MKYLSLIRFSCVVILVASAFAGVNVSTPANGAVVGSPVHYSASASTGCAKGVHPWAFTWITSSSTWSMAKA